MVEFTLRVMAFIAGFFLKSPSTVFISYFLSVTSIFLTPLPSVHVCIVFGIYLRIVLHLVYTSENIYNNYINFLAYNVFEEKNIF